MEGASLIGILHEADQSASLWINSLSVPWTDGMWMMFSDKLFWAPVYIFCIVFLFSRLGWKKALVVIASLALAFGLCDQVSNIVKHAVARLRPCYSFRMLDGGLNVLEKRGGFYGFFSAHAANAFAIAVCLTFGIRNDKSLKYNGFLVASLAWATLVSVSRIFVGKHYLGDVLVGTIIGLAIGCACGFLARYVIRKWLSRAPAGPSPSGSPGTLSQG